jgi:hypothetical protein
MGQAVVAAAMVAEAETAVSCAVVLQIPDVPLPQAVQLKDKDVNAPTRIGRTMTRSIPVREEIGNIKPIPTILRALSLANKVMPINHAPVTSAELIASRTFGLGDSNIGTNPSCQSLTGKSQRPLSC